MKEALACRAVLIPTQIRLTIRPLWQRDVITSPMACHNDITTKFVFKVIMVDVGYRWVDNNELEADLSLQEMQSVYAMLSTYLWRRNSDVKMGMIFDSQEADDMELENKRFLRFNDKRHSLAQYFEVVDVIEK